MNEASHLSSMSFNVASTVDFLVGMTAAEDAVFFDVSVVFAGEDALAAPAGELLFSAAGDADFSVVTDTLGSLACDSDFSGAVASVVGAEVGVSS